MSAVAAPGSDGLVASPERARASSEGVRVLILNTDLPIFPGWGGHEYLNTTRLAGLAGGVGLVSLVHTPEQLEKKRRLAAAGIDLHLWESPMLGAPPGAPAPAPSRTRRLLQSVWDAARNVRGRPADTLIQDLQFRNMSAALLEALSERGWHALVVVQTSSARWLDYVPRCPVSVLVMHDIRAVVYERRAQAARSLRERLAARREARRYRRFEGRYCREYDLVITVSPADEAWVRAHYRPRRLATIRIPVDAGYFAPMPAVREAPARILFTGMMAHPPNVAAACFFAREVLPRVQASVPAAEFWIVGRDPVPAVTALAGRPGVVVTGTVPDMRPFIAEATVVVVPLLFGSGMRNKILEAWAMQKCVISTRVGAEGLEYEDGRNILIADDAETLAARVVDALRDPDLRERTRMAGRAVVTTRHAPDTVAREYHAAIASAVQGCRRGADPMRAVVDLRWMSPGKAGGIETLSRAFVNCLLRLDRFNRYTLLLPAESCYDFALRGHANVRAVMADGPRVLARAAALHALRALHRLMGAGYWRTPEVVTLARARALDAEVGLSIPGYIHPDLSPLGNVLVMPDIQHEYLPELFSPAALAERRRLYTDSARRATRICAISEFTRRSLIERLDIAPDRIVTTHLAADPMFEPGSAERAARDGVLARHGLRAGEYVFFPGNTWPHKNHVGAFRALARLREDHRLAPTLVCTGSAREAHGDVLTSITALGLTGQVRFLGHVPATDLPGLYEGAAALLFPSLFEGFGIPLVEAMWCDCPVVASDTTSLPEIAGDAALLADPRSPEALAAALARVLTDEGLRRTLVARGRRRAAAFSWDRFTLAVIRTLYEVREMRYA